LSTRPRRGPICPAFWRWRAAARRGEALDSVALTTIHRAKGLEFDVVCVADLGRSPSSSAPLLQVGSDGRFGVRLSEPGTDRSLPALHYESLAAERRRREAAEERRLHYVAATRARERLILSGALRLGAPQGRAPMSGAPAGVQAGSPEGAPAGVHSPALTVPRAAAPSPAPAPLPAPAAHAPAATISYSALAQHRRCGLRFYAERVLGLAPTRSAGVRGPGGGPRGRGRN
jgi:ATP-dependent helicase/nuclease subunit A